MTTRFYVDTCIWLNLFKKEGDPSKGVPYWKIAQDFINKVILSEDCGIIYSNIVLKEIYFNLKNKHQFNQKLFFMKRQRKFKFFIMSPQDYELARKFEIECGRAISFCDCLNTAICKRLGMLLVTRDRALIEFAKNHISVNKPENLLI